MIIWLSGVSLANMNDGLNIDQDGNKYWYKGNGFHRDNDLPAIDYADGTKCWYQDDLRHRIGNPAVIWYNGEVHWFLKNVQYSEKDYWKAIGRQYGLLIRDKVKI